MVTHTKVSRAWNKQSSDWFEMRTEKEKHRIKMQNMWETRLQKGKETPIGV